MDDDAAQFGVGFDDQPARGRFEGKPAAQAVAQNGFSRALLARLGYQFADEPIDRELGGNLRREGS
jgi:hypothetical protein